jgi:hypothetical protein
MADYTSSPPGVKTASDRANPDKTQQCLTYDILSEGEIEGLENDLASVFINDVPIIDTNGIEVIKPRNTTVDTTSSSATITSSVFGTINGLSSNNVSGLSLGTRTVMVEKAGKKGTGIASGTAGTQTITTSSSFFTAALLTSIRNAQARGFIRVAGAGPNGIDLVTGATFDSTTQITTDDYIATTVSSADIFIDLVTTISSISSNTATLASAPQVSLTGTNVIISPPKMSQNKIDDLHNIEKFKFGLNRGHLLQPPIVIDTSFGQASVITSPNIELEQNDLRSNVGTTGNLAANYNNTELDEPSQAEGTAADTLLTAAFLEVSNPSEIDEIHLTFQFAASHALKSSSGAKGPSFVELQIFFEYSTDGGSSYTSELIFGPTANEIMTRTGRRGRNVNFFIKGGIVGKAEVSNGYVKPSKQQYTPFIEEFVINAEQFQPYDDFRIRVRRINDVNPKDSSFQHTNPCVLQTVESISKDKLIYPHTAYAALGFNAKDFDGKLPQRAYTLKGLKVQVPTNYRTRDETGGAAAYTRNVTTGATESGYQNWDGNFRGDKTTFNASSPNFKKVYTDNPAWIFYDLVTNERYGLGQFIDKSQIDIYELFRIAKYCDEEVPDGEGGTEPRFSANVYLSKGGEATKVLKQFTSIFRGFALWNDGQLTFSIDRPQQPVYTFTKGNIEGGIFTYEGTGDRVRTNQIKVTWNDPQDNFRQSTEYVEDYQSIAETGRIVRAEQLAFGCTSRGQAHRLGKWKLFSEQNEKETVSFTTGLNAVGLKPGDIINVQDADRDRSSYSGRVSNTGTRSTTVIPLDRSISLPSYSSDFKHQLFLIYPKGGAYLAQESATISSVVYYEGDLIPSITSSADASNLKDDSNNLVQTTWSENLRVEKQEVTTSAGTVSSLTVGSAFSATPDAEVIWALKLFNTEGKELTGSTKEYKIISVSEKDKHKFDIVGAKYFKGKFDAIERGFELNARPTSDSPTFEEVVPAPTNLVVNVRPIDTTSVESGEEGTASGHEAIITWDFPVNSNGTRYKFANGFKLEHNFNGELKTENLGTSNQSFSHTIKQAGEYFIRIRTISNVGTVSQPIVRNVTINESELLPPLQSRFESLARGGDVNQTFTIAANGTISLGNSTYTLISPLREIFSNTSTTASTHSQAFAGMGASAEAYMLFDASDSTDRFKAVQAHTDSTGTVPITYIKEVGASNNGLTAGSGTVSVNRFSNQVDGSSTAFLSEFNAGDIIQVANGSSTTRTTSGAVTSSTAVTLSSTNSAIEVGQTVTGTGIVGPVYVEAISGTSLTLSSKQTIGDGVTLTFTPKTFFGKVRQIDSNTLLFLDEIVQRPYSGSAVKKQSFVPDVARDFILAKVITDGSTNYSISEQYVATTGVQGPPGNDGATGPRTVVTRLNFGSSSSSAPTAPTSSNTNTFNFSTATFDNILSGWSHSTPTYASGNSNKYWYIDVTVVESTFGGTQTLSFGSVTQAIGFSGLVTFSDANTITDGTNTKVPIIASQVNENVTSISGGVISTGVINLATTSGMAIRAGKSSSTDTATGFYLGNDSGSTTPKFSIGSSTKFLKWDGSELSVNGNTVSAGGLSLTSGTTLPRIRYVDGSAGSTLEMVVGTDTDDDFLISTGAVVPAYTNGVLNNASSIRGFAVYGTGSVEFYGNRVNPGSTNTVKLGDISVSQVWEQVDIGTGGLYLTSGTPGATTNRLYNNSGTLFWNGSQLATGGGANNSTITLTGQGGIRIGSETSPTTTSETFTLNQSSTENIRIRLNDSGVTAGTYGSTTVVPQFTVDAQGRITSVSNQNINFSGVSAGTGIDVSGNTVTLDLTDVGFGGGANRLITDDGDGTVTSESNLTFNGSSLSITGAVVASGDVTAFSDERLKKDIKTLKGSKVYEMRGVSFIKDNKKGSGVIAQELEKIAPELVSTTDEGIKSVAYGNITGYLIEAIKELKQEIEELKNK